MHVLVAGAEVGGGDLDLLAGLVERRHQFADGAAEPVGEERPSGMMQLCFRLAAALIDGQRIGVDQRLAHPFGRGRDVGHGAAAGSLGQGGIAVAAGDQRNGVHHPPQVPFDPPGGEGRGPDRRREGNEPGAGEGDRQGRDRRGEEDRQQYPAGGNDPAKRNLHLGNDLKESRRHL